MQATARPRLPNAKTGRRELRVRGMVLRAGTGGFCASVILMSDAKSGRLPKPPHGQGSVHTIYEKHPDLPR